MRSHPTATPRAAMLAGALAATALAAGPVASPAHAGHVSSGWYSWSQAYVLVQGGGPVAGGEAGAHIVNGTLVVPNNFAINGTTAAGPATPGATTLWAEVAAANSAGESAFARSATSLADGTMRASAGAVDPPPFAATTAVTSTAWLYETIWFTNATSSMLPMQAWIDVEGSIAGTDPARANLNWWMVGNLFTPESAGCAALCISATPDGSNPFGTGFTYQRDGTGAIFIFDKAGDDIGNWTITERPGHDPAAGRFDFRMTVSFWVPPGETTLAVNPRFQIIQCGGDTTSCDFGHTASFRFGALPAGLSWTSESGLFLTGLVDPPPPDPTPAPAGLALFALGLGLLAVRARRR